MLWGPAFVATSAALWSFFLLAGGGCGYNGAMCPDACVRVESHLRKHIFGQDLALAQLVEAVCDHVANPSPKKPLVVSLHGPPGVGKTFFHKLLAEAVYNMTGGPGRAAACESGGFDCPAYRVVFGTDYVATEREQQASLLRGSLVNHLHKYPESVLVVEEYDKVDCASRGMLRQLLDKGLTANSSFTRSIIVLEANVGTLHMYKLLSEAPSREALSAETAQRVLKDVLYNKWLKDGCEELVDTQKTLSLVDLYVPFLPLERRHVRTVLEAHLLERRLRGVQAREFASLTWSSDVVDFLVERVEFEGVHAIEGAKEAPVVISRHVSRALRKRLRVFESSEATSNREAPPALRLRRTRDDTIVAE